MYFVVSHRYIFMKALFGSYLVKIKWVFDFMLRVFKFAFGGYRRRRKGRSYSLLRIILDKTIFLNSRPSVVSFATPASSRLNQRVGVMNLQNK